MGHLAHARFATASGAPSGPAVLPSGPALGARGVQPAVVLAALAALTALSLPLALQGQWRHAALAWVAGGLGLSLYHAAYGFTSGFRAVLREGRSAHVRAQLLMLGVAVLLFYPALQAGSVLGQPVRGFVFPISVELVLGAFLFGVGMQIAGGCGSGTLYTAGGGSLRMLVTLTFFIAGATGAAYTAEVWAGLPRLPAVSLPDRFGLAGGLALQLGALGLLAFWLARREARLRGHVVSIWRSPGLLPRAVGPTLLRGPWPYAWGALALAGLALTTLVLAGRPWGITQAFALWGSWGVERSGLDDPHFWPFWEEPTRVEALGRSVLSDTMSLMNLGLMAGALLAAGLAGAFRPVWRMSAGQLVSAVLGGLLLGFGAIMATGCNISALFSGVASGSLHGWVWLLAALPGNALGIALRPLFGLDPARH